MNRSFNSRGISPALLGENSGSLSFADNSSNSLLNGSVTSHNGYVRTWTRIIFSCCRMYMLYVPYIIPLVDCTRLNYPTPFIGKLVTNEYAVKASDEGADITSLFLFTVSLSSHTKVLYKTLPRPDFFNKRI